MALNNIQIWKKREEKNNKYLVFRASHVQVNDKCFLLLCQAETVLSLPAEAQFITSRNCPQDRTDPWSILQASSAQTFSQMPQLFEVFFFLSSPKKWYTLKEDSVKIVFTYRKSGSVKSRVKWVRNVALIRVELHFRVHIYGWCGS